MKRYWIAAALIAAGAGFAAAQGGPGQREMQVEIREVGGPGGGGGGRCEFCPYNRDGMRGMRGMRRRGGMGGPGGPGGMGMGFRRGMGMGFGFMGRGPGERLEDIVMRRGNMILMAAGPLELTDAQKDKIADAMRSAQKQVNSLNAEVENIGIDLRAALHGGDADAGKLKKLVDQKYAAKAKIAKTLIDAHAAIDGTLTQEQKEDIRNHRMGFKGDEDDEDEDEDGEKGGR